MNRQTLHDLIDDLPVSEIETVYKILVRFVPDDEIDHSKINLNWH